MPRPVALIPCLHYLHAISLTDGARSSGAFAIIMTHGSYLAGRNGLRIAQRAMCLDNDSNVGILAAMKCRGRRPCALSDKSEQDQTNVFKTSVCYIRQVRSEQERSRSSTR